MSTLVEAKPDDLDIIVRLLRGMITEPGEFPPETLHIVEPAVRASFPEGVHWFLFLDEQNKPFGTCYLQSIHNYW